MCKSVDKVIEWSEVCLLIEIEIEIDSDRGWGGGPNPSQAGGAV